MKVDPISRRFHESITLNSFRLDPHRAIDLVLFDDVDVTITRFSSSREYLGHQPAAIIISQKRYAELTSAWEIAQKKKEVLNREYPSGSFKMTWEPG